MLVVVIGFAGLQNSVMYGISGVCWGYRVGWSRVCDSGVVVGLGMKSFSGRSTGRRLNSWPRQRVEGKDAFKDGIKMFGRRVALFDNAARMCLAAGLGDKDNSFQHTIGD